MLKMPTTRTVVQFDVDGRTYQLVRLGSDPTDEAPLTRIEKTLGRTMIETALTNNQGNVRKSALDLGIKRTALHARLNRLGLSPADYRQGDKNGTPFPTEY